MADAKERLGKLPCTAPGCGEPTPVKRNAAGTLSMACQECGWSCFVRKGDTGHAAILKKFDVKPAPAPTPEPAPAPPAPPQKAPASVFSLGSL